MTAVREFGLEADLGAKPQELPYGRRRLVAIARAVATDPAILLLDEPAAGLDDAETAELSTLIRQLADRRGIGVLLVEHDMNLVMGVCDRIVVLNFGAILGAGTPAEIRAHPEVIAAYLGVTAPRPAGRGRRRARGRAHGSGVSEVATPVLEARKLSAGYGRVPVVRDLDLHVAAGEVVSLVGPNGAGKTTTLLALAGELPPLGGEVRLHGDVVTAPLHRRARQGLSLSPRSGRCSCGSAPRRTFSSGGSTGSGAWTCSRNSLTACGLRPATCRAASSRCWRSAAR